jgi:hypothetical protein
MPLQEQSWAHLEFVLVCGLLLPWPVLHLHDLLGILLVIGLL